MTLLHPVRCKFIVLDPFHVFFFVRRFSSTISLCLPGPPITLDRCPCRLLQSICAKLTDSHTQQYHCQWLPPVRHNQWHLWGKMSALPGADTTRYFVYRLVAISLSLLTATQTWSWQRLIPHTQYCCHYENSFFTIVPQQTPPDVSPWLGEATSKIPSPMKSEE